MGVFLERVQFKFASIIGELCSDPVVMSQFAVWVDLKIAEYKAKGAMSLECLGDKPEPSWMKGVIPPEHSSRELSTDHSITNPRKGIGVTGEVTLNSSRPHSTEPHHNPLSPEVVVKPEPNSPSPSPSPAAEAYPVTFHHNTTLHCTPSRKRFSEDDSVTDREIHCNKHQRTSSSSSSHILTDALGTPSHQSLLCVLGEEIWENAQLKDIHTCSSGENLLQVASTSDGDPGWGVQDMSSFNNSSSDNSLSQENTDTSNNNNESDSAEEEAGNEVKQEDSIDDSQLTSRPNDNPLPTSVVENHFPNNNERGSDFAEEEAGNEVKQEYSIDSQLPSSDNPIQRSVLKKHFRNITVPEYAAVNGRRNYRKRDYCFYCEGLYQSKISVHYCSVHSDEKRVSDILSLPVGSPGRKHGLLLLQNEGNFRHNLKVIRQQKGELVVSRRLHHGSKYRAEDFLPCEHCYIFLLKEYLWKHAKICMFRPNSEEEIQEGANCIRNGFRMMAPFITAEADKTALDITNGKEETVRKKRPWRIVSK